jgi:hypothetical protein
LKTPRDEIKRFLYMVPDAERFVSKQHGLTAIVLV